MEERRREEMQQRFIDTKLSLTWLLSSAAAIIVSMMLIAINFNRQSDALNAKMDAVLASNAELKLASKDQNQKYDGLRETMYAARRQLDALELRVGVVERDSRSSK